MSKYFPGTDPDRLDYVGGWTTEDSRSLIETLLATGNDYAVEFVHDMDKLFDHGGLMSRALSGVSDADERRIICMAMWAHRERLYDKAENAVACKSCGYRRPLMYDPSQNDIVRLHNGRALCHKCIYLSEAR